MKKILTLILTIAVAMFALCSCCGIPEVTVLFANCIAPLTAVVDDSEDTVETLSFDGSEYNSDDIENDITDNATTIDVEPVIEDIEKVTDTDVTDDTFIPIIDVTPNSIDSDPEPIDTPIVEVTTEKPTVSVSTEPEPVVDVTPDPVPVTYINGQFPLGNYAFGSYVGRLTVPSVGVDVAVYHSNGQGVVDAIDSAGAYYAYESQPDYANYTFIIADHNYQGFNAIKQCAVGTEAYITTSNGTYRYVCDRIILNGHNTGSYLADENYNCIYSTEGGMWLQTCNDCWQNDTLIHFHAT